VRRLTDITHLGRTIDARLASNRVALLAPVGAGLILLGLDTSDLGRAVAGALATFAAWAIARELDPDRTVSATIAAILAPVSTAILGAPAPAALFVVMITLRILTRTTGLPLKTTDLALVTVGTALVADTPWGWAAGILLAFAIVRDAALPGTPPVNAGLWGGLLAVGVTARVALAGGLGTWDLPDTTELVVLALGIAGAVVTLRPIPYLSLADRTRAHLEPQRMREAAAFGILAAVLVAVASGAPGIVATAPLILSYVAIAGVRLAEDVSGR
jgi:hypothetical protein